MTVAFAAWLADKEQALAEIDAKIAAAQEALVVLNDQRSCLVRDLKTAEHVRGLLIGSAVPADDDGDRKRQPTQKTVMEVLGSLGVSATVEYVVTTARMALGIDLKLKTVEDVMRRSVKRGDVIEVGHGHYLLATKAGEMQDEARQAAAD